MKLTKVIIWGHKLHDHTHSYIHYGWYKAFKYLGYETYWLNDDVDLSTLSIDFTNCFFIVHGLRVFNLPIDQSNYYLFHNTHLKRKKYENTIYYMPQKHKLYQNNQFLVNPKIGLLKRNCIANQVYTKDCINRDMKKEDLMYHYYLEPPHYMLYFPWATDLLPHEIDENIKNLEKKRIENISYFVGMSHSKWDIYKECLKNRGINYKNYGGTFNVNSDRNKSSKENMELIQKSRLAPALQTDWQVRAQYIPCRIFKNISYGKMGITNSLAVHKLFDEKLIYSENIEVLVDKSLEFEKRGDKYDVIKDLMKEVRDKHTYLNRIDYIKWYLNEYLEVEL